MKRCPACKRVENDDTLVFCRGDGTLGYSRVTTLTAIAVGALVATVMIPLCGWLSDRVGRRRIFLVGCAGLVAFSVPYFWLLSQRSTFCILVASVVAIGLIWPLVTATLSTLLA